MEKWPGTLFGCLVHGILFRKGMKAAYLKDGKEWTLRTLGTNVPQVYPYWCKG